MVDFINRVTTSLISANYQTKLAEKAVNVYDYAKAKHDTGTMDRALNYATDAFKEANKKIEDCKDDLKEAQKDAKTEADEKLKKEIEEQNSTTSENQDTTDTSDSNQTDTENPENNEEKKITKVYNSDGTAEVTYKSESGSEASKGQHVDSLS
jgi:hypothetical protein